MAAAAAVGVSVVELLGHPDDLVVNGFMGRAIESGTGTAAALSRRLGRDG